MTLLAMVPLLAVGLLSGCAGYRVGSMLPDDIQSIYVPTFVNKTKEPLVEVEATQKTLEEFQRDGSLEVATSEDMADALLEVTIIYYGLDPLSYRRETRTATREYRLNLVASIVMTRRSDGSVIVENPRVHGETTFELLGDLSSAKIQALPKAAEDLAHKIVEQVVEVW
jgi:hypothetical protein